MSETAPAKALLTEHQPLRQCFAESGPVASIPSEIMPLLHRAAMTPWLSLGSDVTLTDSERNRKARMTDRRRAGPPPRQPGADPAVGVDRDHPASRTGAAFAELRSGGGVVDRGGGDPSAFGAAGISGGVGADWSWDAPRAS